MREIYITIYLLFYKIFFGIFSIFRTKNKVTILASFAENNEYLYNKLKEVYAGEIIFVCKASCYDKIKQLHPQTYVIEKGKILDEMKAAYHIKTSKTIIADNYYGLLAAIKFCSNVECIQIWHAVGAVKNFGFLDPYVQNRSDREKKRFLSVYNNMHKIVVGSTTFEKIFEKAFFAKDYQFLHFGFPRTDFFHDEALHSELRSRFYRLHPELEQKKLILYAPTYRPQPEQNQLTLNIEKMQESLGGEFALLVRTHPSVTLPIENPKFDGFLYDFSKNISINELLVVTDYLITDYSSIPFEFSFFNKPMIFYPYDLKEYEKTPGIWTAYEDIVPGPIAYSTDEILQLIQKGEFPDYRKFNYTWNEFCLGKSTENLVNYIVERSK